MRSCHPQRSFGFALTEPLIAMAVVSLIASSTFYSFFFVNRYAATQRFMSGAKALCQERIDDALTQALTPGNVPALFGGAWPMPAVETLTSTETVPIYVSPDTLNNALVNGTRRTWVTAYTPVGGNTSFVFARVRVRVEFWSDGRGLQNQRSTSAGAQPFSYEMTTLRSLD
jgi:type II secretory pathway pseudopilin PulG